MLIDQKQVYSLGVDACISLSILASKHFAQRDLRHDQPMRIGGGNNSSKFMKDTDFAFVEKRLGGEPRGHHDPQLVGAIKRPSGHWHERLGVLTRFDNGEFRAF